MRRVILAFVATVAGLVLLLSFKTASPKSTTRPAALSDAPATARDDNGASSPTPAPSTSGPSADATPSPTPAPAKNSATKTVTGSSVRVSEGFRTFGSVQVQVTLANGKITKLVAVDYPRDDSRSYEISRYSIPVLEQEVLAAQGTQIDIVSGATYTSDAYAQSVQAALDSAKS